jgi:hypothetical protein
MMMILGGIGPPMKPPKVAEITGRVGFLRFDAHGPPAPSTLFVAWFDRMLIG